MSLNDDPPLSVHNPCKACLYGFGTYILSYHFVVAAEEMNMNNTFVCMERALLLYLILVYFEL